MLRRLKITPPREIVDSLETTDSECTLTRRQMIGAFFVAVEEPVAAKPFLQALERASHAGMGRALVAQAPHQKQCRVEPVPVEFAHIAAYGFVESASLDRLSDLVALATKYLDIYAHVSTFVEL